MWIGDPLREDMGGTISGLSHRGKHTHHPGCPLSSSSFVLSEQGHLGNSCTNTHIPSSWSTRPMCGRRGSLSWGDYRVLWVKPRRAPDCLPPADTSGIPLPRRKTPFLKRSLSQSQVEEKNERIQQTESHPSRGDVRGLPCAFPKRKGASGHGQLR